MYRETPPDGRRSGWRQPDALIEHAVVPAVGPSVVRDLSVLLLGAVDLLLAVPEIGLYADPEIILLVDPGIVRHVRGVAANPHNDPETVLHMLGLRLDAVVHHVADPGIINATPSGVTITPRATCRLGLPTTRLSARPTTGAIMTSVECTLTSHSNSATRLMNISFVLVLGTVQLGHRDRPQHSSLRFGCSSRRGRTLRLGLQ